MRGWFGLLVVALVCSSLAASCSGGGAHPRDGDWHAELDLGEARLPFHFAITYDSAGRMAMEVRNAGERISISDTRLTSDSLIARMPIFETELRCRVLNDSTLTGEWANHLKGPEYRIPLKATRSGSARFGTHEADVALRMSGSWETHFSSGTTDAYNAVGVFDAFDGGLGGTFLTETGDYRFLEGAARSDSLFLSCFDGSHAFLFKAHLRGDSLDGRFWSGTHWQEPWVAVRNPDYSLRDPDSLTLMRSGYEAIEFRFRDTEGVERSPSDYDVQGHPLIVHIMGSWCPNCADETKVLKEMHEKYAAHGLRIMAIAFEKQADEKRALEGLRRFKQVLAIPYPVLYGGPAAKDQAAARLPFLNRLISYPTCIFIDRAGRVRRIRTGFYGPGTGSYYADYRTKLDSFLQALVAER